MSDHNFESSAGPKQLSPLDIDKAPEQPGIYAWYAELGLSDEDWKPDLAGGLDRAAMYLRNAISDYSRIHEAGPLDLTAKGTYDLPFSGTLRRSSIADTEPGVGQSTVAKRLGGHDVDPAVRHLLITLLRSAVPVFASPLYIGVATNLRTRLGDHMTDYENAYAVFRQHPTLAEQRRFEGESFGERLAASGLQLDYLKCWVMPAKLDSAAGADDASMTAREVAEAAEWILQRIFLPVLGRR